MRRLDEWHKYVDLQSRRADSARSAAVPPSRSMQEDAPSDTVSEIHPDLAAQATLDEIGEPVQALMAEWPEPAYMRPTPLPPQIEYAPAELPSYAGLSQTEPHPSIPQPQPADEMPQDGLYDTALAEPVRRRPLPPPRSARGQRPAGTARKETREELLARLLDPELTLEEAAQVLNVCPTTVRRYTNRGVLPHYRTMGNQRRFRLSQVLAFLETQEASSRSLSGPLASSNGLRESEQSLPAGEHSAPGDVGGFELPQEEPSSKS